MESNERILMAIADGDAHLATAVSRKTGCTPHQIERVAADGFVRPQENGTLIRITPRGVRQLQTFHGEQKRET